MEVRFEPTGLILSGGGTRCLAYGELLVLLENAGHLTKVTKMWGTSAGALVGMLYILCRSAARVKSLLWELDFSTLRNVEVSNLLNIVNTWAMDDGHAMLAGIEKLMETAIPGSSSWRLRDCPGIHTIIADLTRGVTLVVSAANYPNLRVAEAVRASMTLPIYVKPYISPEGHYWVDGGLRANFPWFQVAEEDRASAIAFRFSSGERKSPRNLNEFIHSMVHFDEPKKDFALHGQNIIEIPTPPYPAWFLRLRPTDYELVSALALQSFDVWVSRRSKPSVASAEGNALFASLTNVRLGDSMCPPETSGSPPPSAPPCTHPPTSPLHCTAESSGNHLACPTPSQDSSQPLLPPLTRPSRRWSL